MAQPVKCLPVKQGDLSMGLRTHVKHLVVVTHIYNASTREAQTGRSLPLAGQPV